MDTYGITQVGPAWWKGRRIIVIEEAARIIPAALSGETLSQCQKQGIGVELCLFTGEETHRLAVMIILRTESAYYYEVLDKLERSSGILLRRLIQAGFRAHTADQKEADVALLHRFFGGNESRISMARGFFPGEKNLGLRGYYVPDGYRSDPDKPFDLTRIAGILALYPFAFFAIQATPTPLTHEELGAITHNRAFYSRYAAVDENARTAMNVYAQWEKNMGLPHFFVSLFGVGSRDYIQDLEAQMSFWHYEAYQIPPEVLSKPDYPMNGEREMARAAALYGHLWNIMPTLRYLRRLAHLAPLKDVTAALPLPRSGEGIPGLAVSGAHQARGRIPDRLKKEKGIYLGRQQGTDIPIRIPPDDLTRHGFIVGKPGSGKTTFALGLLHQLYSQGYPFLAIEPAKREYRGMLAAVKGLRIYTPGRNDVSPISLNPFLPPKGVTLEEYLPDLDAIFGLSIALDHPLDVIFPQVIRACYRKYGWRPDSTRDTPGVKIFGMHEFIRAYREYIRRSYAEDREALNNLEAGGVIRLQALTQTYPVLFDTNRSMDFDELLEHPTVIELDAVSNIDEKALIMALIMIQLMLTIRKQGQYDGKLKNAILIDEAHLLLGQQGALREGALDTAGAGVRLLQNMVLILRAYGTAMLFSDQSPARLTREILDNVNLKMMFRLDSQQDRAILSDSALMDGEMIKEMVSLPAGKGFMYMDALNEPICVVTPNSKKDLKLEEEVPDSRVAELMRSEALPPFSQCAYCKACSGGCDFKLRSDARFIAEHLMDLEDVSAALKKDDQKDITTWEQNQEDVTGFILNRLPQCVREAVKRFGMAVADENRFMDCVRAQFIRQLQGSGLCSVSDNGLIAAAWPEEGEKLTREANGILLQKVILRDDHA